MVCIRSQGTVQQLRRRGTENAKAQAEQIQFIDNLAPVCNIGCQVYFTNVLNFRLDDPPAGGGRRVRTIKITRSEFEHANDEPIRTVTDLRGPISILSRKCLKIGETQEFVIPQRKLIAMWSKNTACSGDLDFKRDAVCTMSSKKLDNLGSKRKIWMKGKPPYQNTGSASYARYSLAPR